MSIGKNVDVEVVKATMAARDWSVKQLAEKTGFEPARLKRIFKAGATSDEVIWALQDALDIKVSELLGFTPGRLTTGQSLQVTRLEAHMTVKELEAESGVNASNIRNYENDSAMPRLDMAWQIAAALDQSIERVFFRYIGILE